MNQLRKEIDCYIIKNWKQIETGRKSCNKCITIITAIRDKFSHPDAKFNGQSLDVEQEINKNIKELCDVVRGAIRTHLKLPQQ